MLSPRHAVHIQKIQPPKASPAAAGHLKDELLQPTKRLKIDSPSSSPDPQIKPQKHKDTNDRPKSFWTHNLHFQEGTDDQEEEAKGGINIEELIDQEIQNRTLKSTSVWSKSKNK